MPGKITVFTDGACKGNPGPGGWAALIIDGQGKETLVSGGPIPHTTNQRMEVTAAIEGLRRVPPGSVVKLSSDSLYVVNTMELNWKRRANHDLWAELDALVSQRSVAFEWVRGHNGHPQQERVDKAASTAATNGR